MPDDEKIRQHKHLQILGPIINSPNLWHLNRRSVSGAFAVGLFMAWVPLPFQMILAAIAAVVFSVNLPISVVLVWITNPVTIPPMFYFAYWVGTKILPVETQKFAFELSWEWLTTSLGNIWEPFLFGCFVVGTISSITGYIVIRLLWRLHIIQHLKDRRNR